jgi:osmotically-inducible protein OsmY
MPANPEMVPALVDHRALAMRIKRAVRRNAGGGVRQLDVAVDEHVVRLHGRCASFYCKQLAQQAAMRLAGAARVINEIEVEAD